MRSLPILLILLAAVTCRSQDAGGTSGEDPCEAIFVTAPGTQAGDLTTMYPSATNQSCGFVPFLAQDMWFTFDACGTGIVTCSTDPCTSAGSGTFNTTLAAYTGPDCYTLTEIGCNADSPSCPGNLSTLVVPVLSEETYWIRVAGLNGAVGTFDLDFQGQLGTPTAPPWQLNSAECAHEIEGTYGPGKGGFEAYLEVETFATFSLTSPSGTALGYECTLCAVPTIPRGSQLLIYQTCTQTINLDFAAPCIWFNGTVFGTPGSAVILPFPSGGISGAFFVPAYGFLGSIQCVTVDPTVVDGFCLSRATNIFGDEGPL